MDNFPTINYKSDIDHSEAVDPNTGLTIKQMNELNEYGITLLNTLLKKNGLKPITASQDINNIVGGVSAQEYANNPLSTQQWTDKISSATATDNFPNGVTVQEAITANGYAGEGYNELNSKLSMLDFAVAVARTVAKDKNELIDAVRTSEQSGNTPSVNFTWYTHGLDFKYDNVHHYTILQGKSNVNPSIMVSGRIGVDNDGNLISDGGTPIANTGFVDSIRQAQAGTPTPDLNAPSVVNAKKALDQAKNQLKTDQQALDSLKNDQSNPLTVLTKQHNNKLAALKTTYDNAVKAADQAYTKSVNDAKAKYTKQGAQQAYDQAIKAAQTKHDTAVKNANAKYNAAVKSANDAYDLAIKQAQGDPSYLTDLKSQLTNKLNDLIQADQAKIDALKAERDAKLAALKKDFDTKTSDEIQVILSKYGVSDAQLKAKIDPLLADIQANKEAIAKLQHQDVQNAAQANANQSTQDVINGVSLGANGDYDYVNGATIAFPKSDSGAGNVVSHGEATANEGQLPQTSSSSNIAAVALGAIAAMLGFGLAKKREY